MIANRILASAACVPLLAAAAVGQSFTAPPPPSVYSAAEVKPSGGWPAPTSLFPGRGGVRLAGDEQPAGEKPKDEAKGSTPLNAPTPSAVDTLTGTFPLPTVAGTPLVPNPIPGAVYSPWSGDTFAGGCCGPTGANGPVTYEPYFRTGVSLLTGGGRLTSAAKTFGWSVQAGGRTLLFDPAGDAAWVLDLGVSRTNNQGRGAGRPFNLNRNAVRFGGPGVGDEPTFAVGLKEMRRTSFNFGLGRDYFLYGSGVVGEEGQGNFRAGWDVGGRWGTASVDLEPFLDPGGHRRSHDIFHGFYLGGQGTWEQPMGSWTFFFGGRIEWGYYWTDIIPPNDGDFREVNLLLLAGVRF